MSKDRKNYLKLVKWMAARFNLKLSQIMTARGYRTQKIYGLYSNIGDLARASKTKTDLHASAYLSGRPIDIFRKLQRYSSIFYQKEEKYPIGTIRPTMAVLEQPFFGLSYEEIQLKYDIDGHPDEA